ncbi:unnamed protein product [Chilo suppressalis]|uniref:Uncharacterized protein n=1 Tax=Chilo suppressalis TaxID=168631 RepID=A0ABN8B725_CHISP|nr:unnamed protein product [Chilo suppressalis]
MRNRSGRTKAAARDERARVEDLRLARAHSAPANDPPLVYCDYHGHSRKKNVFFYGCAAAESWCSNDRLVQDEPVKYLRERESTARVTVWRHLGVTRSYTMEASFCGFDRGPFKSIARVTVLWHLGVTRSYTMEASFCVFDREPFKVCKGMLSTQMLPMLLYDNILLTLALTFCSFHKEHRPRHRVATPRCHAILHHRSLLLRFKGFHLNTQHLQSVGSDFCEALNGLNDTATNVDIQLTKDLNGVIAVDSEAGSGSDSVLKTDSDEDFD